MFHDMHNILAFDPVSWIIWTAIAMAASYGLSRATQKKPRSIKTKPNTFNTPVIEENHKLTIVFGTCWVEDYVIGWWGDSNASTWKMRIDDSGGQYVYFYQYYHGALHIIAQGVCDGILQIKCGDPVVWPQPGNKNYLADDGESQAVIDLPNLYGGITTYHGSYSLGGGLTGTIDLEYGENTQTLNDYLESVLGSYIPANRGLTCAILRRMNVGTDPNVQPWSYLVKRTGKLTTGETQWYSAKATIRDYEINPVHILRECYTNNDWGLGHSTGKFSDAVWQAAADALYDEGFGLCMKWEGDQSLEDFIGDVLEHIEAVIYEDHSTGQFVLKLIRDDYVIETLDTYDEQSGIIKIEDFSRGTMYKVPDITYLEYWSLLDNLPAVIPTPDSGLITGQGELMIPNEVSMTGIIDETLAAQVAAREQRQMSTFPAIMRIVGNRTMSSLQPGDVFILSYAPLGIESMVIRIITASYGTAKSGQVEFDCMEDIFGLASSVYTVAPVSIWSNYVGTEDGDGIYDYPSPLYDAISNEMMVDADSGEYIYWDA